MHQLKFHPRVIKQIKKLHPQDQKRFLKTVTKLLQNPFSRGLDIKKLAGTKNSYRLRIRDFRIIYSVDKKRKTIYLWQVGYRGSIY